MTPPVMSSKPDLPPRSFSDSSDKPSWKRKREYSGSSSLFFSMTEFGLNFSASWPPDLLLVISCHHLVPVLQTIVTLHQLITTDLLFPFPTWPIIGSPGETGLLHLHNWHSLSHLPVWLSPPRQSTWPNSCLTTCLLGPTLLT